MQQVAQNIRHRKLRVLSVPDPIATAAAMRTALAGQAARKKPRVAVVGAVGMMVPREPYYKKEIELVVSCSSGLGRYDPSYEDGGQDYPGDSPEDGGS